MLVRAEVVEHSQAIFGVRLLGLLVFGSRVSGRPRPHSDLDVGVWLAGPIRRRDAWVPWVEALGHVEPTLDPTFFTTASLAAPPSWLLEAVRGGVEVWLDRDGRLARALDAIHAAMDDGTYRRRLFMGLPYYERSDAEVALASLQEVLGLIGQAFTRNGTPVPGAE